EVANEFVHGRLRPIGSRRFRRLVSAYDPPDSAAGAIAARMVERHFVVADDAVVKVGDVERPIGSELDIDWPEPRIAARKKIGLLLRRCVCRAEPLDV